ncbi:MAG TPA: GSCFA domain-containing protein [Flavobacterium sp.]|nr:GSCFA domain-containing protein [Flavobacterium sp.]
MQLQTFVPIPSLKRKINYLSKISSLGSCFAVNISQKLTSFQFQNQVNPLGILFHPLALERVIEYAAIDKVFEKDDSFLHNEIWSCFDAHSDMNKLDQEDLLLKLNAKIKDFKKDLTEASHFILTLGTAWVYRHKTSNQIVANCHKIPQKEFDKELLTPEQVSTSLERLFTQLKSINPNIQIIVTLSPVRHIKDGMVENQRSKAHLIVGIHDFMETHSEVFYFPSYEIVMDELRDYRFFGKDLIHPNEIALDYIWEKFVQSCIDSDHFATMQLVNEVQKGLAHRPFNPYSEQHQQFLDKLAQKLDLLLEQYPFMNFR